MSTVTAITGATGFLGRRLCEMLVAQGERIIAIGRNFASFPPLDARLCRLATGSLQDGPALERAVAGASTVVHTAALSTPWGRREDFLRVNVEGTCALLEASRRAGVRRFVHVSSASVVFKARDQLDIAEDETLPKNYLSFYSESKALAEQAVRSASGMECVIIRPRGIFGPRDGTLLPRVIGLARRHKLRIVGDGRNIQDLTYVDNVAHALMQARYARAATGKTYFVSNGEPVHLWGLIAEVLSGLDLRLPQRHIPFRLAMAGAVTLESLHRCFPSLGEPRLTRYTVALLGCHQTLNISAVRRDLGYAPLVTMTDGVASTIDWFRAHYRG